MLPQAAATYAALGGRKLAPDQAMAGVVGWARERFDRVLLVFLFRNSIDQAISRIVAHSTGIFHSTDPAYRLATAQRIDIADMNQRILRELDAVLRNREMLLGILDEHDDVALALTYDELVGDVEAYTGKLLGHAVAQGFRPQRDVVDRVLRKVISLEQADSFRESFLEYLRTETGLPD